MAEASLTAARFDDDQRLSKADRIYLAVKQAIVRGELTPGAAIDKSALCDRFAVSRLPVTTAINRLAYEGLILIERQKGSYVARIRLDDVLQWMMVRRAVEAEVAAEAARRLDPETHRGDATATCATRRPRSPPATTTASCSSTWRSTGC